jgi:hypothetical protein
MTTHTNPAISSRTVFSLPYRDHSWASAATSTILVEVNFVTLVSHDILATMDFSVGDILLYILE